jgi:eukaryotic-like serine/threonine-protein kinase
MTNPQIIGKYEIIKELGRGGFGIVYEAHDTQLKRTVALKVLHPYHADPTFVQRFEREARIAARFNHPNIVTIHEVGEVAGQHYLAMAYVEGQTLAELLKNGPLPVEQVLTIIKQVASALDTIHTQRLVHRDVKPGNIMLTAEEQAILLDFGLVRAAEGTRLTQSLASLGTAEYMAPEQIEQDEETELDGRADIYALGVVAYEMLVDRLPFTATSPMKLLYKHLHEAPPMPTHLKPDLVAGLEPPLLKVLAKLPAERFQQAGEFAAALQQAWQGEQVTWLYQRFQEAAGAEDWAEVLLLGGQISAAKADYQDVPEWLARARKAIKALPQPSPAPPPLVPSSQPKFRQTSFQGGLTWENDGKKMVHIEAGEFLYGDKKEERMLPEFWIDKTPVTNAEYQRFLAANPEHPVPFVDEKRTRAYNWNPKTRTFPRDKADHPVVLVSWYDALAYADWAGKRLPIEEEWEKAARGTDGRIYPWGDQPPTSKVANFIDKFGGTTPVGRYSPQGDSPYGCVDMSGNVWEWTASDYNKDTKVLRGGGWDDIEGYLRITNRYYLVLDIRRYFIGFRCVVSSDF